MWIDAKDAIYIGDTSADIIGSKKVGMKSVLINRTNRQNLKFKPNFEINSLEKLNELLELS